ncbi:hypothetical protein WOA01_06855 [Methylocystis sp. IM2]|uniref:hypothetical protein n=1 Tax=Methylocystis sp. IM2 TaxID=3136563 RepID=UPI0030F5B45A
MRRLGPDDAEAQLAERAGAVIMRERRAGGGVFDWKGRRILRLHGHDLPIAEDMIVARRRRAPEGRAELRQQGDADNQRCEQSSPHETRSIQIQA